MMRSGKIREKGSAYGKVIISMLIVGAFIITIVPNSEAIMTTRTTQIFTGSHYVQKYQIVQSGLNKGITDMEYSPDGTRIAIAYKDGEVELRSAATGGILVDNFYPTSKIGCQGGNKWVDDISWSPDGTKIVIISYQGRCIQAWHFSPASPQEPLNEIWYTPDVFYNKVAWIAGGNYIVALFPNVPGDLQPTCPVTPHQSGFVEIYDATFNPPTVQWNPPYANKACFYYHLPDPLTALSAGVWKENIGGTYYDTFVIGSQGKRIEKWYIVPGSPPIPTSQWPYGPLSSGTSITNISISKWPRIAITMDGNPAAVEVRNSDGSYFGGFSLTSSFSHAISYSPFVFTSTTGIYPLAVSDNTDLKVYKEDGTLLQILTTSGTRTGKIYSISWTTDANQVGSGDDGTSAQSQPQVHIYKDSTSVVLEVCNKIYKVVGMNEIRQLKFSWNSIPGATQYRVYRATSPNTFNFATPIASVTTTTWIDTAALWDEEQSYYYLVRTQMSSGAIGTPSNMAYKMAVNLVGGYYQSIALPYYAPAKWSGPSSVHQHITNSADILSDINFFGSVANSVGRYDSGGWIYSFPQLYPGEAYKVEMTGSIWYQMAGAWSETVGTPLTDGTSQMKFDALPGNMLFGDNYLQGHTQQNNVGMWKKNVGPRCTYIYQLMTTGDPDLNNPLSDGYVPDPNVGYFVKTDYLGWKYNGPYTLWYTPIYVQPDPPIENVNIVARHKIGLRIMITGEPGDSLRGVLLEDNYLARSLDVSRNIGKPEDSANSTWFWKSYDDEKNYMLKLEPISNPHGNMPVWVSFNAGGETFWKLIMLGDEPTTLNVTSEINNAAISSKLYYFAALGPNSPDTTYWNFGDGSEAQGVYVSHRYALPGDNTVAVTIKLEDGTVLWSGTKQLEVI